MNNVKGMFPGSKYTKTAFAAGAPSIFRRGSLQRSSDSLAGFGRTFRGGDGMIWNYRNASQLPNIVYLDSQWRVSQQGDRAVA